MSTRLQTRLVPEIDFTVNDYAILALVDMAKCPIALDITNEMIIFNQQCNDNGNFEVVRYAAVESNTLYPNIHSKENLS